MYETSSDILTQSMLERTSFEVEPEPIKCVCIHHLFYKGKKNN